MMKTLGWERGQGLGRKHQGRVDPVNLRPKDNQMGLGFWEMELKQAQDATEKRKLLEVEKEITPELMLKYAETALKEKERAVMVAEMRRDFYCELCDKQYTKYSQYDNHLNSYSHAHKQRLEQLKNFEKGRKFGRKKESKQSSVSSAPSNSSDKKSGGFVPTFIPMGVSRDNDYSTTDVQNTMATVHQPSVGLPGQTTAKGTDPEVGRGDVDKQTSTSVVDKQTSTSVVDKQTSTTAVDKQTSTTAVDKQTTYVEKQAPPPMLDMFDMFADDPVSRSGRDLNSVHGTDHSHLVHDKPKVIAESTSTPVETQQQQQQQGSFKKSLFLPRVAMKGKPLKRAPKSSQKNPASQDEDRACSKKLKEEEPWYQTVEETETAVWKVAQTVEETETAVWKVAQTVEETEAAVWKVAQKLHQRFSNSATSEAFLERCRERIARYKVAQRFVAGGTIILDTSEFEHGSDQPLPTPRERVEHFEDTRPNELEHLKGFVIGFRKKQLPLDKSL